MSKSLVDSIIDAWNKRIPFLTHRTKEGKERLAKFLAHIYRRGMTNLGQNKAELKLQSLADEIWNRAYGSKLPYRLFYSVGYTDHLYQSIHLPGFDPNDEEDVNTLCHELAHVVDPTKPHGKRFEAKVNKLVAIAEEVLSAIS